jgi:formate-dependent nitrite reductase membrane component NrfD
MNRFAENPDWGWWIVFYFYLGGIAAGAYFVSTLIELFGSEEDRELPRIGYWLALPLIIFCGIFLTVDLYRPERFWHMMFATDVVDKALEDGWPTSGEGWSGIWSAPILKFWSPMSAGSWALAIFGLCSGLSLLGSFRSEGFLPNLLRRGILGRTLQIVGCLAGFFVASYTGALLTATNQPLWSNTVWIASLFLASAASTAISAMILLARWFSIGSGETLARLERADIWALGLEMVVFIVFLASLGSDLQAVMNTINGKVLIFGTFLLGLLLPLALHLRVLGMRHLNIQAAAVCALLGGFLLRYAILKTPGELLERHAATASVHSDDGRNLAAASAPGKADQR